MDPWNICMYVVTTHNRTEVCMLKVPSIDRLFNITFGPQLQQTAHSALFFCPGNGHSPDQLLETLDLIWIPLSSL